MSIADKIVVNPKRAGGGRRLVVVALSVVALVASALGAGAATVHSDRYGVGSAAHAGRHR